MKRYRVSLEIVTSPAVTDSQLADLLGVPSSALAQERVKRSILWRYEPSAGQTGKLADRIRQLAEEVHPRQELSRGAGVRRVSLGIDVLYDTARCTVLLPLYDLVYGQEPLVEVIPELGSVELTCTASEEDLAPSEHGDQPTYDPDPSHEEARKRYDAWKEAGRPRAPRARVPLVMDHSKRRFRVQGSRRRDQTDTNRYAVSLDAITSTSATRSEVADVLGLPAAAFVRRSIRDGVAWRCKLEAHQTVGLRERIRFLTSAAHPRLSYDPDGEIDEICLDVGVFWDVNKAEACFVRLPLSDLRALVRKLFVLHVEVSCYPCDDEAG